MLRALFDTMPHVQQNDEFAEQVVALLGAIVVVTDPRYRVVSWNDRFATLHGGDASASRGRHLAEIVSPGATDVARFEAAMAAIERAEHHACGVQRYIAEGGEAREIAWSAAPLHDEEGKVSGFVGVGRDVTDTVEARQARRLSEERFGDFVRNLHERTVELERLLREKDVLLAEVHHRVKNNLQSISGLLHMMAARAHLRPMHETIEELEQRIQTMALVHETLCRSSNLAAVDMQTYLERITRAEPRAPGRKRLDVEIDVRAGAVTLDLDAAVRCGLIVNELVQNARKHAFVRKKRGRIDVRMEREGDRLVLRVSDDGKGLPSDLDFDSETTMGLRLVRGLAEQLGGSVRRVPNARSAIEVELSTSR